jgi:hypothetical protein
MEVVMADVTAAVRYYGVVTLADGRGYLLKEHLTTGESAS